MKNNIKNKPVAMVSKCFALLILFSVSLISCKKDEPVVPKTEPISALELSHHELILFEHQKEEVYVTSGDATKTSSSDEKLVKAVLKGTTINISALSAGDAVISVTGSDKKELKIKIAVKSASEALPEGVVVENGTLKTWPCDKIPDDGIAVIPISVKTIGKEAFKGCSFLKAVAIPMGLKTIEEEAFLGCTNLSKPNLPTSIEKIEKGAFKDCGFNLSVSTKELKLYEKEKGEIQVENYLLADVSSSDKNIATAIFSEGKISIEAISKGECLIKLYDTALDSEKEIQIKVEAASDKTPEGAVIEDGVLTSWFCGKVPFHGHIEIPTTVKKLGNRAFAHCTTIKSVKIPDSVEKMGWEAFYQCTELKKVELSKSLKIIPQNAFRECFALESINIPNSVEIIGILAFGECNSLKIPTLGENLKIIEEGAFSHCIFGDKLVIPASIEKIGKGAFQHSDGLKTIDFSKTNLESIPEWSFWNCSKLETILFPKNIKKIENNAFVSCAALKEVTLPASIISIEESAFKYCWGLTKVVLKSQTPPDVEEDSFLFDDPDIIFYVPAGTKDAYLNAEVWKDRLEPEKIVEL